MQKAKNCKTNLKPDFFRRKKPSLLSFTAKPSFWRDPQDEALPLNQKAYKATLAKSLGLAKQLP